MREAVLKDAAARRRILAIVLHEKVRSEALAIRHDANGSTVHADNSEGFTSAALDGIRGYGFELTGIAGTRCADVGMPVA